MFIVLSPYSPGCDEAFREAYLVFLKTSLTWPLCVCISLYLILLSCLQIVSSRGFFLEEVLPGSIFQLGKLFTTKKTEKEIKRFKKKKKNDSVEIDNLPSVLSAPDSSIDKHLSTSESAVEPNNKVVLTLNYSPTTFSQTPSNSKLKYADKNKPTIKEIDQSIKAPKIITKSIKKLVLKEIEKNQEMSNKKQKKTTKPYLPSELQSTTTLSETQPTISSLNHAPTIIASESPSQTATDTLTYLQTAPTIIESKSSSKTTTLKDETDGSYSTKAALDDSHLTTELIPRSNIVLSLKSAFQPYEDSIYNKSELTSMPPSTEINETDLSSDTAHHVPYAYNPYMPQITLNRDLETPLMYQEQNTESDLSSEGYTRNPLREPMESGLSHEISQTNGSREGLDNYQIKYPRNERKNKLMNQLMSKRRGGMRDQWRRRENVEPYEVIISNVVSEELTSPVETDYSNVTTNNRNKSNLFEKYLLEAKLRKYRLKSKMLTNQVHKPDHSTMESSFTLPTQQIKSMQKVKNWNNQCTNFDLFQTDRTENRLNRLPSRKGLHKEKLNETYKIDQEESDEKAVKTDLGNLHLDWKETNKTKYRNQITKKNNSKRKKMNHVDSNFSRILHSYQNEKGSQFYFIENNNLQKSNSKIRRNHKKIFIED